MVQDELKPAEVKNQPKVKIVGQSLNHQFRTGRLYGLLGVLHTLSQNPCCKNSFIRLCGRGVILIATDAFNKYKTAASCTTLGFILILLCPIPSLLPPQSPFAPGEIHLPPFISNSASICTRRGTDRFHGPSRTSIWYWYHRRWQGLHLLRQHDYHPRPTSRMPRPTQHLPDPLKKRLHHVKIIHHQQRVRGDLVCACVGEVTDKARVKGVL